MGSLINKRGLKLLLNTEKAVWSLKRRTTTDYAQDPVFTLSSYNYKIDASISLSTDTKLETISLLGTGSVSKLTRADHLSDEVLIRMDKNKMVVNLRSTNNQGLTNLNIVNFPVQVKG